MEASEFRDATDCYTIFGTYRRRRGSRIHGRDTLGLDLHRGAVWALIYPLAHGGDHRLHGLQLLSSREGTGWDLLVNYKDIKQNPRRQHQVGAIFLHGRGWTTPPLLRPPQLLPTRLL